MMRRVGIASLVLAAVLAPVAPVQAQTNAFLGRIRGRVVDPTGNGIPGVQIEITLEKTNRPRKWKQTTDKKGGYVRVGLDEGNYRLVFSREGYRTVDATTWISLGGVSEIPPVTMKPVAVAAEGGAATSTTSAPPAPAVTIETGEFAKLKGRFDKAVEALKANDLATAETLLGELITAAPRVPEFHFNLGLVLEQKQDLARAEAEYRTSSELDPGRSDSYSSLARILLLTRQRDAAMKVVADALTRFPDDARLQYDMGVRSFELGLAQEAAAVFKRVQTLDAANPEPVYYLGLLALQEGRLADALEQLQRYVALGGQDKRNLGAAQAIIVDLKKSK